MEKQSMINRMRIFRTLVVIGAYALIVLYSNWQVALGIFLAAYHHNLERNHGLFR